VVVGYDIAGVGTRLMAQMIDLAILFAIAMGGVFALSLASMVSDVVAVTAMVIFVSVLPFAYFLVQEARSGTTVGKRALGIRVVTDEGAPIGWRESAIRNLVRLIDFLPALYLLGGAVAIASSRSKRLGDLAAGTVTIRMSADDRQRFAQATTFAEAAGQVDSGRVPAELVAILVQYRRRREELLPEVRRDLAEQLAVRLDAYHPRPDGMSLEEFVVRAAVTYGATRRR
jgi:uncharacterized RDD family membrane protein YckC